MRVVSYCDQLNRPCFRPLTDLLDEQHQNVFRAAALLHDVGHPPTSHTIEFALVSWCGLDHTDFGEHLIMHGGVRNALEENGIAPRTVVDVLKRRSHDPLLMLISDFIDSPLDIDKTDYLIRDAHFSGVQLGIFPAERVLLTNRVVMDDSGKWVRAFMLKALHSLESLALSRNWMFSDLYIHHAVRVAEALTSKATYFRLKEEQFSKEECIGLFTRMTDGDLYRWLEQSKIDFVREYAARIRYRRLYKVVLSKPISAFENEVQAKLLSLLSDAETLVETERELMEDVGSVLIDVVNPELGDRTLGRIPLLVGSESAGYRIVDFKDTPEGRPVIMTLRQQKKTIPSVRVYADPKIGSEVQKRFDRMFPANADQVVEEEYDHTDF
jgi:HD superfamily phosphohydrolase